MSPDTRKIRRHSAAGCVGKIGYPTRAEAEEVRANLRKRRGDEGQHRLNVYHCDQCGKFHLGRNVKNSLIRRPRGDDWHFRSKLRRWLELTGGQGD